MPNNDHQGQDIGGALSITGQANLPLECITAGSDFQEALARATIKSQAQRNNIDLLWHQYCLFDEVTAEYPKGVFYDEKQLLINLLISTNADGTNWSRASQNYTGIYSLEGQKLDLTKEDKKAYYEGLRAQLEQKRKEEEGTPTP